MNIRKFSIELHHRLKAVAALRGVTLRELFIIILTEWLEHVEGDKE